MSGPHILFWGHEPRAATGWTDPDRVSAYVYNTATGQGVEWRVPDAPFLMETFCMADHGIVSSYRVGGAGRIEPVLLSPANDAAEPWGLQLYRSTLYAFCTALFSDRGLRGDDVRPLVHQVMDAFWCRPALAEAAAWGVYPLRQRPGRNCRATARPAIHRPGLCRPRRPCVARGITRLEHARGPSGIPEPRSRVRDRRCP